MPSINLGAKKARDKTLAKKSYQHIYQDKRWKILRRAKIRENPLCERCEKLGITTQAQEVHHKKPFKTGSSREEIESLALDISTEDLESLCIKCHKIVEKLTQNS